MAGLAEPLREGTSSSDGIYVADDGIRATQFFSGIVGGRVNYRLAATLPPHPAGS